MDHLRDRWEKVWQKLNVIAPHEVFEELIRVYSLPERFYHNLSHIENCLSLFDQTLSLTIHSGEVELAIWFHDAVYDTRRNDNEQKSAEWTESVINQSGVSSDVAERVSHLILATRHNMEVTDTDAQLIIDIDLSILGSEADVFWRYEENIRKEYAWVPVHLFKQKRIEILRGFLDRPYIYYHQQYREMFEEKARVNLKNAIMKLSDGTDLA